MHGDRLGEIAKPIDSLAERAEPVVPKPEEFRLDDAAIQADPYSYYSILRDQKPVLRTTVGDQTWWVLSRQEDVSRALMDPKTFSSRILADPAILFLDPPEHSRLRAMVAPWFSRKATNLLVAPITSHAEALVSKVAEAGKCDIVKDFAEKLTITMISGMLGIPAQSAGGLLEARRFIPDFLAYREAARLGVEPTPQALAANDVFEATHGAVIDGSFRDDGVVADLVRHLRQGELTRSQCMSYVSILFGAGHSTTTDLIGNAVYVLTKRPGDLDRLAQDASFVSPFIEEVLRTRPSFHRISRITTRDVEVAGQHIPAGSLVRLLLASANRDPALHDDAEVFDPDKERRMHMAFGKGIHTCLGSWLARLEATIALRVLSSHVAAVELDMDNLPSFHSGGTVNNFGFKQLPVTVRGRRALSHSGDQA